MIKKVIGIIAIYLVTTSNVIYADNIKLALADNEDRQFINTLNDIKDKNNTNSKNYPKISYKADDYISLKKVDKESIQNKDNNSSNIQTRGYTPQQYLSLKKIFGPMPDKYAQAYLKLKTLDAPLYHIVKVYVNKRRQRMSIYLDNKRLYTFKVSTARSGYWTPRGTFRPRSLERMHYSRKYHNSPMPYSVFFKGGYAIHGTHSIYRLGHPASHGCVRVHPRNAKKLYTLIRRYGKRHTKIVIY